MVHIILIKIRFHTHSIIQTAAKASSLCKKLAQLHEKCSQASPTMFHLALKMLDERGGLRRVYTQNIDMLESKAGLSVKVPQTSSHKQAPRCIPLHGTLETLICHKCCHVSPMHLHISTLSSGHLPLCPSCERMEHERQKSNKRPWTLGTLFPNVVLYGETHPTADHLGRCISHDAKGDVNTSKPDVLLVAGTSLQVPGIANAVRLFAEAVHTAGPGGGYRSIYLNHKPLPSQWEGVFDASISGDLQIFAQHLLHFKGIQDDKIETPYIPFGHILQIPVANLPPDVASLMDGQENILLNVQHPLYIPKLFR